METKLKSAKPVIDEVHQFLETVQDFTDPKEAIREALSNSLEWGATRIEITANMDKNKNPPELLLELSDNGSGLDESRLQAFFALGRSTGLKYDKLGNKTSGKIGEKGHGTKTYFNSRQIEVPSKSRDGEIYALMDDPLGTLRAKGVLPDYEYEVKPGTHPESDTYLRIALHGYNENQTGSFAHDVLRDYIMWFSKFGSFEREFGVHDNEKKVLLLKGLDRDEPEKIPFGHVFPKENSNSAKLKAQFPGDWIDYYVKKWRFPKQAVLDHPGVTIDFVFYLEGDEAKRQYNHMIRGRGKSAKPNQYKVEDRYGIYAAKDYVPVERVNEWLSLRRRMETKFHAFVNCQDFRLTANRGDVGNTPADLLAKIEETVLKVFNDSIVNSPEYYEYESYTREYKGEVTAEKERKDFDRRRAAALKKRGATFKNGIEVLEPRLEAGVFGLFVILKTLYPTIFPFNIIDYDTSIGYDALVSHKSVVDLTKDSMSFVEFKYALQKQFDHAFAHLNYIVCWECGLPDGTEVTDVGGKMRQLSISDPQGAKEYRKFMLTSKTESHNIEVFVLSDYIPERLKLSFKPRAGA